MRERDERDWDERDAGYGGRDEWRQRPAARGDWRATGHERSREQRHDYYGDRSDPSGEGFGDMRRYHEEWRYGRADRMDPIEEVGDLRERGSRVTPNRDRDRGGRFDADRAWPDEDREYREGRWRPTDRFSGDAHDEERRRAVEADARRREAMRRDQMHRDQLRRDYEAQGRGERSGRFSGRQDVGPERDRSGGWQQGAPRGRGGQDEGRERHGDPVVQSRRGFGSGSGTAGASRGSGLLPSGGEGISTGSFETGRLEDRTMSGGLGSAGKGGVGSFGGSYQDTISFGLTSSAADAGGDRVLHRGFGRGERAAADHTSSAGYAGRGPRNYRRSDARIEEDVCDALMRDPHVDASDVDVRVRDGEVTLTGEVEDRKARRHAEEVVERCAGVRDVHNHLKARRGLLGSIFGGGERAD